MMCNMGQKQSMLVSHSAEQGSGKTFTECLARMQSYEPLTQEALADALRLFGEQFGMSGFTSVSAFVEVFDQNICCETCLNAALQLGKQKKLFTILKKGCPINTRTVIDSNRKIVKKPQQSIVAVKNCAVSV